MIKKKTPPFSIKIIYSYLLLTMIFIFWGVIGFCIYYYRTISISTHNVIHQLNTSAANQIELQISAMDNLAQQLVSNKALIETMRQMSTSNKSYPCNSFVTNYNVADQLSSIIMQTCLPSLLMERISVANDRGDYLAVSSNYKFLDLNKEYNARLYSDDFLSLYAQIKHKEITRFTAYSPRDKWLPSNDMPIISCFRPITDNYTFQIHGILEVQRPFTIIEDILKEINYNDVQVFLLDASGQLIYSNIPNANDDLLSSVISRNDLPFSDYATIESAGWQLISILPSASVYKPIMNVILIVVLILLSLIIFALSAVSVIEKNIRIPLEELKSSLESIDLNNLDVNINSQSVELEQVHQALLEIMVRLKTSIQRNEYLHRQDLKSQMFALQAQINPHFIHNILTIIGALGQEAGAPQIMRICRKFSDMLSYSTEYNDGFTTLAQELNHTENYLFLMKERYGDNLNYKIILPHDIDLNQPVPKLFLQPLVENCISHAFEYTLTPWQIIILCRETTETWEIEIHDNGCGFTKEAKEKIFERYNNYKENPTLNVLDAKIGGLGIISSAIRMHLLYDSRIIFDIGTSKLCGSKITIGAYKNDQCINCRRRTSDS